VISKDFELATHSSHSSFAHTRTAGTSIGGVPGGIIEDVSVNENHDSDIPRRGDQVDKVAPDHSIFSGVGIIGGASITSESSLTVLQFE
jgi:hypothetical protein